MEDPATMETLPWGARQRIDRRVTALNRIMAATLAAEAGHLADEQVGLKSSQEFVYYL